MGNKKLKGPIKEDRLVSSTETSLVFSLASRQTIIIQSVIMSVSDYGDILYMHASLSTLKPLEAVYHSVLGFITAHGFYNDTHHYL